MSIYGYTAFHTVLYRVISLLIRRLWTPRFGGQRLDISSFPLHAQASGMKIKSITVMRISFPAEIFVGYTNRIPSLACGHVKMGCTIGSRCVRKCCCICIILCILNLSHCAYLCTYIYFPLAPVLNTVLYEYYYWLSPIFCPSCQKILFITSAKPKNA